MMVRSLGATLALAALGGCAKPAAERPASVPVEIASVTRIAAPLTIAANGVVEPLATVAIQAQVGGTLDSVLFREGEEVRAGEVLFRLDARPFQTALRQAEAALSRDESQSRSAQRDLERARTLLKEKVATQVEADQAEARAGALIGTLRSDSAAVDNARLNLAYTTIRSPIGGRTGRLLVKQGNLVRANVDPLVVINQLRPILVRFPVVQPDFPGLQRRMARGPVVVRVVTADSGHVRDGGTLSFLDNAVDSLTGTVTAKARFANGNDALWPGEYVRVSVELEVQADVVAVPTRAVLAGQQGSYVFVVGDDKVAQVRPVTTGRAVGAMTTIPTGLAPGERVVVDGQSRLTQGARVDIKDTKAPAA
jgi:multidrug efflux system membrane fusion protein